MVSLVTVVLFEVSYADSGDTTQPSESTKYVRILSYSSAFKHAIDFAVSWLIVTCTEIFVVYLVSELWAWDYG